MAKTKIRGITIQLGGDTSGLDKALKGTNQHIRDTQSQLKDVERLLKLDPKNTVLLEQKQRLLAEAAEQTKEKLETLNKANDQLRSDMGKEIDAKQFDALQREIAATEQALERLEDQSKLSFDKISSGADKVADTMMPITTGIMGLGTAAVATVPATEELREGLSRMETAAQMNGVSTDLVMQTWKDLQVVSGDTGSAVEAVNNLLAAKLEGSQLEMAVRGIAGAVTAFPDTMKIESLADSLQETLATGSATGQFAELLERCGYNLEEVNASVALFQDRTQQENYLLGLLNQNMGAHYDAWKQTNAEMIESKEASLELELAMAGVAEKVLPYMTDATQAIADFLDKFLSLPEGVQGGIVAVLAFVASIGPTAEVVSNVSKALDFLSGDKLPFLGKALDSIGGVKLPGLQAAFSSVFGFIASNPIVLLIAAIAGLVAAVATGGDEMQQILESFNEFLQVGFARDWTEVFGPVLGGALNGFFDTVKEIWDAFYQIANGVIDFIRGVFTGNWERAWSGVVGIFKGIFDGLGTIVKAPLNAVISMINKVIDGCNRFADLANRIPGMSFGKLNRIPMLASGGDVLRGTALVGEDGPELLTVTQDKTVVQPLSQTTNHRTTQLGGVNMHIYGAPGQDVRELADLIMEEMQGMCDREEAALT